MSESDAVENPPPPAPRTPYDDPDRMVFFSDAVFAIAMTLLVLDLKPTLPANPDRQAFDAALLGALRGSAADAQPGAAVPRGLHPAAASSTGGPPIRPTGTARGPR